MIDIENCTLQEACDYAVAKLVEQGKPCSFVDGGRTYCAYGDAEGNHCAVGWLLDSENPDLMEFDGNIYDMIEGLGEFVPDLIRKHSDVFTLLQGFHDTSSPNAREENLDLLSRFIDVSKPQYQQWLDVRRKHHYNK